jgi:hypothetical protein
MAQFSAVLGVANSQLGNIELGANAGASPPSVAIPSPVPEVSGGPLTFAPWKVTAYSPPPQQPPAPPPPVPSIGFTGLFGTSTSAWAHLEYAAQTQLSPASQSPQPQNVFGGPLWFGPLAIKTYAPQPHNQLPTPEPANKPPPPVTRGPLRGAPYYHQAITDQQAVVAAPFVATPAQPPPPAVILGPVPGAPYYRRFVHDQQANIQPPPPPPAIMPPEVAGGPIPFVPWRGGRPVVEQFTPIGVPPAAPPAIGPYPQVEAGPLSFGPLSAGRPVAIQPVVGPNPPPTPPTPPSTVGNVGPVPRALPDDRRLGRFTEVVSVGLNSLFEQGLLSLEGTNGQWTFADQVTSFDGRTGAITFEVTDLPASGVVPGNYFLPNVSIDTYGRVTAASSNFGGQYAPFLGNGPGIPPGFGTQLVQIDSRQAVVVNNGSSASATITFNLAQGDRQYLLLTGTPTLAISNLNNIPIFTLILAQDTNGSRTVNWFSTIRWAGGSAPTLTTTPSKIDVFTFINGALFGLAANTYLGFVAGQNL